MSTHMLAAILIFIPFSIVTCKACLFQSISDRPMGLILYLFPSKRFDILSLQFICRQVFSRMRDLKAEESPVEYITTGRYDYFIQNILPRYQSDDMSGIVIVIPSYFDFVRYDLSVSYGTIIKFLLIY